jgi:hypothetical protein
VREYGGGGAKYGGGSNVNADFKSASSSLFFFPPHRSPGGTEMLADILKAEALPSCEREEVARLGSGWRRFEFWLGAGNGWIWEGR